MKHTTLTVAAFALSLLGANGGAITGTNIALAGPGDVLITEFGTNAPLSTGVVEVGFFTVGFDVNLAVTNALATNDFSALFTNWKPLASAPFYDAANLAPNMFGYYNVAGVYTTGPAAPIGAALYTFISNGPVLTSTNVLTGGMLGLLQSNQVINDEAPPSPPDSNDLLPSNSIVKIGLGGQSVPYDWTSVGGGPGTADAIQLYGAIPEPSTALLGLAGALVFFRRRR